MNLFFPIRLIKFDKLALHSLDLPPSPVIRDCHLNWTIHVSICFSITFTVFKVLVQDEICLKISVFKDKAKILLR